MCAFVYDSFAPNDNVVIKTEVTNNITRITVVPFVCHLCKRAFTQYIHLEEHWESHSNGNGLETAKNEGPSVDVEESAPAIEDEVFECEVCCQEHSKTEECVKIKPELHNNEMSGNSMGQWIGFTVEVSSA
ncbi:zinc finger protein [Nephila pilipes]|uniref:Zinc finger protein n=1 Tax=Nephila pilipes TaxID=299642 RepID=A0A8X6TDW8_NEPPI|nr:zinc finger protein [Nephila pilipes]